MRPDSRCPPDVRNVWFGRATSFGRVRVVNLCMFPKRRLRKSERTLGKVFFYDDADRLRRCVVMPSRPGVCHSSPLGGQSPPIYASQTKILENETAGRVCLFEAFCEVLSPKSSTHTLAKSIETTRPTRCFVFRNLRLGSIQLYAPQTKILENETARWACRFDGLCEDS